MTCIAAPVLWAYVHDDRLWTLCLDLQCGVERVLCVCDDMIRLSVQLEPYGKLHLQPSTPHRYGAADQSRMTFLRIVILLQLLV